jgi:hypothetical protein
MKQIYLAEGPSGEFHFMYKVGQSIVIDDVELGVICSIGVDDGHSGLTVSAYDEDGEPIARAFGVPVVLVGYR